MAKPNIIDSHIHLWPQDAANEDGHSWMTPGMPLAKQHLLSDYYRASQQGESSGWDTTVKGVVYVETDRRYDAPDADLASWAKGPLNEVAFLRQIVEGDYGKRDSDMLRGLVIWAPINQSTEILQEYLSLAKERAGPKTWERVKGVRFLLQAIHDQTTFKQLMNGKDFIQNLKLLGEMGLSFDVGVDQHSGGSWQLELVAEAMSTAHHGVTEDKKTIFIINHLCKPNFGGNKDEFDLWTKSISEMAGLTKSYMKLSGAFSELPPTLRTAQEIADFMRPWISHVFNKFKHRVLFGSDYPVLNIMGAAGEYSWLLWKDVIQIILDSKEYGLDDDEREEIWFMTAMQAYRLRE
ncbi:Hypothetical protein R9X50_00791200 [Acrodontium crateriforme]|uniref:Amidohydrolase-related domain-containing protein n=1 Tax=Acrodontium crateriforme TaxID=150365 RepID=A0AAQ3MAZ0_9PEZI|nr:Hypothetical protein R9X50_00791200 [Acrodontium crateriforme]